MNARHAYPAHSVDLNEFLAAREFLLRNRDDYETVYRDFRWPALDRFNWALDYFDEYARENHKAALRIVDDHGDEFSLSFAELARRSNQVANFLRRHGVRRGDRILVMLPNVVAIWETMLAAMKLGAVVIPAATLLTANDLRDRFRRGHARHVICIGPAAEKFASLGDEFRFTGIVVGSELQGWLRYEDAYDEPATYSPDGDTSASDPFLLYFTSGTTAFPKLVLHTHQTYPVGILPRCTGSEYVRRMFIATLVLQAGRSTPGAASSPRGMRVPPSSSTTTHASTANARWPRSRAAA